MVAVKVRFNLRVRVRVRVHQKIGDFIMQSENLTPLLLIAD
jgi:hypothetical protein